MPNNSEFVLFHSSKVNEIVDTENGGVLFTTTSRETFVLLVDKLANAVIERIIPEVDKIQKLTLQPISEAKSVLKNAQTTNQFVHIFAAELFGIKLYRLECFPVPGYARKAYEDSRTSEKEKDELCKITAFIEENPEFKAKALGHFIAIVNEEVVPMFYSVVSDIHKTVKVHDRCCFFRVDDDYKVE